jgi:hypothetical protein
MSDVLRYYPAERKFEWRGREWILGRTAAKVLIILLETPGHYVTAETIAARLWPKQRGDYWRNSVTNYAKEIKLALYGTSADLEPAAKKWSGGQGVQDAESGRYYAGYRIIGQIEVIPPQSGNCPTCGQPMPLKEESNETPIKD